MAARTSPTFRRRRLGRRLRELREQAGLSLEVAAPMLDKTRSSLARIESGETRADVHLVRSMMDVYDVRDDDLIRLSRDAAHKGWWRQYGLSDLGYVDAETEAVRVLEFSVLNIPGLLQTPAYSRALTAGVTGGQTAAQRNNVVNVVEVRRIRQRRLVEDDHPLELVAVIDEAALHRQVGGPQVMGPQLTRLVETESHPRVALQVVPFSSGVHVTMAGAFTVLEYPEEHDPDLLYVTHPGGALQVEKPAPVRAARLDFDRLRSQALPPQESADLIGRLARDLYRTS